MPSFTFSSDQAAVTKTARNQNSMSTPDGCPDRQGPTGWAGYSRVLTLALAPMALKCMLHRPSPRSPPKRTSIVRQDMDVEIGPAWAAFMDARNSATSPSWSLSEANAASKETSMGAGRR